MSTTFSMTAADIVQEALENIGVAGDNVLTTKQLSRGLRAINMHLKLWSHQGMDGFLRNTQSVSLVSGTASYDLSPRPTEVMNCYLRDDDNEDSPMMELKKEEYEAIVDKDAEGDPTAWWVDDSVLGTATLYTWPVIAQASYTLRVDYRRPLSDVTVGTDVIAVRQDWLIALVAAVEAYIAPKDGKKPDTKKAGEFYSAAYGVTKQLPPNPIMGWPGEFD